MAKEKRKTSKLTSTDNKKDKSLNNTSKNTSTKKQAAEKVSNSTNKIILEIDGNQINLSEVESKAAMLGGDVYIVVGERKLYNTNGESVNIF